jgi:hypothetical protein
MKSIYEQAIELGLDIKHHETDLYLKDTPETRKLLKDYEFKVNVTSFVSQIDECFWFDIPFAYDPIWNKKYEM